MKILYLHQYYNTPQMQGGTRSHEFAKRLAENGHTVTLFTTDRTQADERGWRVSRDGNVEVHWFAQPYSNSFGFIKRLWAFTAFSFAALWRSRKIECDLVFATSTPLTIAIPGIFKSYISTVPLVFEVRDLWPEMPIAAGVLRNRVLIVISKWIERFAYSRSEAVIALSPGMKKGVLITGYDERRVCVIPNACDLDLFSPSKNILDDSAPMHTSVEKLKGKKYLLYAGTIGAINGVCYLITLAKSLALLNSDLTVVVVGAGKELELVRETAQNMGVLDEYFYLIDGLPKNEVVWLFKNATFCSSIFLDVPEMQSNSSNKFYDGLASGKPMFINYGGWHADLLTFNKCGLVGWRKNIDEVANELNLWVRDEAVLADASNNSLKLASSRFSRELMFDDFHDVLKLASQNKGTSVSCVNDI